MNTDRRNLRLAITGAKAYGDAATIERILTPMDDRRRIAEVITEKSGSVPKLVAQWAVGRGVKVTIVEASLHEHNQNAVTERIKMMLRHHPDGMIVFGSDALTSRFIEAAKYKGTPLMEVE